MSMTLIRHRIRRFYRDEDGILLAEFLVLLPLLIWAYLAFFLFWDAFASINRAQKATYAISDAISRTSNTTTVAGLNSYVPVLQYLIGNAQIADSARLRVTSFQWDEPNARYVVLYSYSPNNRMRALTASDLMNIQDEIPLLMDRDSLVMVESQVDYRPPMQGGIIGGRTGDGGGITIGVPSNTLNNRVFERPRFVRRICMNSGFSCPSNM